MVTPQTRSSSLRVQVLYSPAIMQLVEDRKMNIDAPVSTYLPSFRVGDRVRGSLPRRGKMGVRFGRGRSKA